MIKLDRAELIILIAGSLIFLLLSLLLQGYVSTVHPFSDIDSSAYLRNGFLWYKYTNFSPVHAQQQLPIYALGYPLFIGFVYKIFGPCAVHVIWLQVLFAWIAGLLLFFTTRRLVGSFVAMVAYVLWSVNLGVVVFSHFILAEMLLIFFLILFFERFSAFWLSGSLSALGLAGFALGCSVLMKAAALYFPFILLVFLGLKYWQSCGVLLKRIIVFMIPFLIPLLAFMMHNRVVFNQFRLTYIDSFNLCACFYSQVLAHERGTTWGVEINNLTKTCKTSGQDFDAIKQQFLQDFFSRPHVFVVMWLRNVFKIFAGLYSTSLKTLVNDNIRGGTISYFTMHGNWWQKAHGYITCGAPYPWVKFVAIFEVVWSFMRYVLCCLGLWVLWRTRQRLLLAFFLSYIFYFSFVIACDGTARYRFFFEFVLIILAAPGIQMLVSLSKKTCVQK